MVLDIADLAPQAREVYLALGQRYGSTSVVAQADKTLQGISRHADVLLLAGFGLEDAQILGQARDALVDQCTRRDQAALARRVGASMHTDALRTARRERQSGRTMLQIARGRLVALGAGDAARRVQVALDQTRRLSSVKALPDHLPTLLGAMRQPDVASIIAGRGGPQAVQRMEQALAQLRATMEERASHTPVTAEAEQRNVIAGLIVSLVRSANDAARLAARSQGLPSIAAEFKLTHLTPWRSRQRKSSAPPDLAPESAADETR